jgi:hypothetical protein
MQPLAKTPNRFWAASVDLFATMFDRRHEGGNGKACVDLAFDSANEMVARLYRDEIVTTAGVTYRTFNPP